MKQQQKLTYCRDFTVWVVHTGEVTGLWRFWTSPLNAFRNRLRLHFQACFQCRTRTMFCSNSSPAVAKNKLHRNEPLFQKLFCPARCWFDRASDSMTICCYIKGILLLQMGDEVHENTELINNVTGRETPQKRNHLNRIHVRLPVSIYKLYHNASSAVLLSVCIIYCIRCQVFTVLLRGLSWFCLRVFKETHISKFRWQSHSKVRRPFDYKTVPDDNNCALPPYCY